MCIRDGVLKEVGLRQDFVSEWKSCTCLTTSECDFLSLIDVMEVDG